MIYFKVVKVFKKKKILAHTVFLKLFNVFFQLIKDCEKGKNELIIDTKQKLPQYFLQQGIEIK